MAGLNWATVGKPALQQHPPEVFHDPAVLNQPKIPKQLMQLLFLHLKGNSEDLRSGSRRNQGQPKAKGRRVHPEREGDAPSQLQAML